jgi:hypothetical protein
MPSGSSAGVALIIVSDEARYNVVRVFRRGVSFVSEFAAGRFGSSAERGGH